MSITLRAAEPADTATILGFVRELAVFEREPDAVVATEPMLAEALFARARRPRPSSPSVTGRRRLCPVLRQFLDLDRAAGSVSGRPLRHAHRAWAGVARRC